MIFGELDYQRVFFANALRKSDSSMKDMAADLHIHPNTLRKWVRGEQQAPTIAFSAIFMYLKLHFLGEEFNLEEFPSYKDLRKENISFTTETSEFKVFMSRANGILEDTIKTEYSDEDFYFIYSCIHDREKIEEVCLAIKRGIKEPETSSGRGLLKPREKFGKSMLIAKYIEQYPDESLPSIKSAFKDCLIDKNVMAFSVTKRLDFIDGMYNFWLADLRGRATCSSNPEIEKILSKFDYDSDSFSPKEFVSLRDLVRRFYIEVNGTDKINSVKALALREGIVCNIDHL